MRERAGAGIRAGSSASVSFTLHGAEFAERVLARDLSLRNVAEGARVRIARMAGGAPGDAGVTFEVDVAEGALRSAGDTPATLVFAPPPVTRALAAMTEPASPGVQLQVEVVASGGFADFPDRDQRLPDGPDAGDASDPDLGLRVLIPRPEPGDRALSVTTALRAEQGTIDTDTREVLLFDRPRDPQFLTVASVSLALDAGLLQADGKVFSVAERGPGGRGGGHGAGVLQVSAVGEFRDGDVLLFDRDADGEADDGEALDVSGSVATVEFALEDIVSGEYRVLYFPNGVDALRSGLIATTFAVAFQRRTNAALEPVRDLARPQYLNAGAALLAYAIPAPSHADRSYIRIRCGSSSACRVFMACDGADGAHYFGELDTPVASRSVETVTAWRLAEAIGATDEDFAGRMSCALLGEDIAVQSFSRTWGTLVNHTYVARPLQSASAGSR